MAYQSDSSYDNSSIWECLFGLHNDIFNHDFMYFFLNIKIKILFLFLMHGFHAQGYLFYRSITHWVLLGLFIKSTNQLIHCHVWKTISLQVKYPLVEVIKEVFSVIKLAKIIKKTYATTSISGKRGFGRDFNGNSTQLKKMGGQRLLQMFFHRRSYQVLMHRYVSVDSASGRLKENATGR